MRRGCLECLLARRNTIRSPVKRVPATVRNVRWCLWAGRRASIPPLCISIAIGLLNSQALGQGLHEAMIVGQPLQYMKDGRVNGCGVRMMGIADSAGPGSSVGFDVSFNVCVDGFGLVKGGAFRVFLGGNPVAVQERVRVKPTSVWIKAQGSVATVPIGNRIHDGQDPPESIFYAVPAESSLPLFRAAFQRQSVQVGVHFAGEPTERVFYGMTNMSDSEWSSLRGCIDELVK